MFNDSITTPTMAPTPTPTMAPTPTPTMALTRIATLRHAQMEDGVKAVKGVKIAIKQSWQNFVTIIFTCKKIVTMF